MIEEEEETSVVTVLRIGCDRSTNTLFIQYRQEIGEENCEIPAKTKRIRLKKCTHEVIKDCFALRRHIKFTIGSQQDSCFLEKKISLVSCSSS
jgi:hypothetical protein